MRVEGGPIPSTIKRGSATDREVKCWDESALQKAYLTFLQYRYPVAPKKLPFLKRLPERLPLNNDIFQSFADGCARRFGSRQNKWVSNVTRISPKASEMKMSSADAEIGY
jgi:hypothetical protein